MEPPEPAVATAQDGELRLTLKALLAELNERRRGKRARPGDVNVREELLDDPKAVFSIVGGQVLGYVVVITLLAHGSIKSAFLVLAPHSRR